MQAPPEVQFQVLLTTAAALLLVVLGYTISPVLSPFLAAGGLLYLLWPWRALPVVRRTIALAVLLTAAWLVVTLGPVLVPFLLAFFLAYLFNPVVTRAQARGVPRWAAALACILSLLGIGAAALFLLLPAAVSQSEGILLGARDLVENARAAVGADQVAALLERLGIPMDQARALAADQFAPALEQMLRLLLGGVLDVLTGFSAVLLHVVNLVIVPFLAFYLLLDFPLILERAVGLWPAAARERVRDHGRRMDAVLGRYIRGALIVAAIQGTIAGVALWFLGVRYPLVLGIMTGILNVIPYLGLLTSLIVASIIALFSGGAVGAKVAGVVVLFLSQKLLEASVLGPKIIGPQVGLHPVLLIFCLLVFGTFLGLLGMLIAVPVTALLMLLLRAWEDRRAAAELNGGEAP